MIPRLFRGLCDDAPLLLPGDTPIEIAVQQHLSYKDAAFSDLVGPLMIPIPRLDELTDVTEPLSISLIASGGPATVEAALDRMYAKSNLTVATIEVALPDGTDITALGAVDPAIDVYVEIPRGQHRAEVFDAVDERGYHAKFRTGGVTADAYPGEQELAAAIHEAARREISFKAVAGLDHAVRNTNADTGFEQHGYLNVLLAAQAAHSGAKASDLATILALRDPEVLAQHVAAIETERAFLSFDTGNIRQLLDDLISLGLLPPM